MKGKPIEKKGIRSCSFSGSEVKKREMEGKFRSELGWEALVHKFSRTVSSPFELFLSFFHGSLLPLSFIAHPPFFSLPYKFQSSFFCDMELVF